MATTSVPRADALIALGGLREMSARLAELAERERRLEPPDTMPLHVTCEACGADVGLRLVEGGGGS